MVVAALRLGLTLLRYARLKTLIPAAEGVAPPEALARISWSVERAARLVPGATCLTQALAVQYLLARLGYGSQLRVGVKGKPGGGFQAHAWVLSEGRAVFGVSAQDLEDYAPLADLSPRRPD